MCIFYSVLSLGARIHYTGGTVIRQISISFSFFPTYSHSAGTGLSKVVCDQKSEKALQVERHFTFVSELHKFFC